MTNEANMQDAAVPMSALVAEVFAAYPAAVRKRLFEVRKLIYAVARSTDGVGELTETRKWGEPAYLTQASKSGSTIRLGWKAATPDAYALYFNCNTTLVETFRTCFPELDYAGNRAIVLEVTEAPPLDALEHCIELALTYHLRKRVSKCTQRRAVR